MCSCPTSIVVFPIAACSLHGSVAACSSPAQLADAMPAVHVQSASAIAIAQARASLCKANSHIFKHTRNTKHHSLERASLKSFFPLPSVYFSTPTRCLSTWKELALVSGWWWPLNGQLLLALPEGPHSITSLTALKEWWVSGGTEILLLHCKSKPAHCSLSFSKHLLSKTSTWSYLRCIWG